MGRPTKLTPDIAQLIVTMIEGGVPRDHAARAAGIVPSTLYRWLAIGEAEDTDPVTERSGSKAALRALAADRGLDPVPATWTKAQLADWINDHPSPYSEFSDRVRAADSRFLAYAIGNMRQTGEGDWRMWDRLVERRFPELRITHTSDDEGSGTSLDQEAAQKALERADEIKVKMLGTG